jgi:hypothetical protein
MELRGLLALILASNRHIRLRRQWNRLHSATGEKEAVKLCG